MRAKTIKNSEKILYKGTPAWVNQNDLYNPEVKKLFVFKDEDLQQPIKTTAGMTVMVRKSDLEDELKENANINLSNKDIEKGLEAISFARGLLLKNDPILANYCIRDLRITELAGLKDLSWAIDKQGYASNEEISEIIKELEDFLKSTNLQENILGGAGYAVYGGGSGGGFGNPSLGGRFTGRGFGFGSSGNLHGGPNLMYTYDIKPLNRTLEPLPSETKESRDIHIGTLIKGKILGKDEEVIGKVLAIDEDGENNKN